MITATSCDLNDVCTRIAVDFSLTASDVQGALNVWLYVVGVTLSMWLLGAFSSAVLKMFKGY